MTRCLDLSSPGSEAADSNGVNRRYQLLVLLSSKSMQKALHPGLASAAWKVGTVGACRLRRCTERTQSVQQ